MRKLVLASLAVVALVSACKDQTIKTVPERQGARGESCLVTNDCKSGLLCIADRCIDEDFALKATAKVCVSAQCIDTADCCLPKSKAQLAQCEALKSDCAQFPDGFECQQFDQQCGKCMATCTNHSCVVPDAPNPAGCTKNSDCGDEAICDAGQCVDCAKDLDCGTGFVCEDSFCQRGCTRDEQCGALSACTSGRCDKRDCKDDRECVAFTGRPDSVCAKSGQCSIPCDNDGGCASLGGLFSCVEGYCAYAGCETNAECAADRQAGGGIGRGLQLCLDKAEADKVTFGG